jgi:hypothetical protein
VRMVGGAVVDVVVVDLDTPAVAAVVVAMSVGSLGHRQDRDGQDHQKDQTPLYRVHCALPPLARHRSKGPTHHFRDARTVTKFCEG